MLAPVSSLPLFDARPDEDHQANVDALVALLAGRKVVALTGAGCSTESGIPDYRGNGRPAPRHPNQHDAFLRRPEVRRRYWARAALGWQRFSAAQPNAAHHALAELEGAGLLRGIITQNVDRLHQRAGSRRVIELHGALADVVCLVCGAREDRADLQARLLAANPGWLDRAGALAPDGDAELPPEDVDSFQVIACARCAGTLMPDVVFFGGAVPEAKVAAAWALLDEAEVLLVVGSSLAVYSGWRFARGARERGIPIAIINIGATRADEISHLRVEAAAGAILPALAARLVARSAGART
jgi:NAD-dependent SIR2 family protein deacetylase